MISMSGQRAMVFMTGLRVWLGLHSRSAQKQTRHSATRILRNMMLDSDAAVIDKLERPEQLDLATRYAGDAVDPKRQEIRMSSEPRCQTWDPNGLRQFLPFVSLGPGLAQ